MTQKEHSFYSESLFGKLISRLKQSMRGVSGVVDITQSGNLSSKVTDENVIEPDNISRREFLMKAGAFGLFGGLSYLLKSNMDVLSNYFRNTNKETIDLPENEKLTLEEINEIKHKFFSEYIDLNFPNQMYSHLIRTVYISVYNYFYLRDSSIKEKFTPKEYLHHFLENFKGSCKQYEGDFLSVISLCLIGFENMDLTLPGKRNKDNIISAGQTGFRKLPKSLTNFISGGFYSETSYIHKFIKKVGLAGVPSYDYPRLVGPLTYFMNDLEVAECLQSMFFGVIPTDDNKVDGSHFFRFTNQKNELSEQLKNLSDQTELSMLNRNILEDQRAILGLYIQMFMENGGNEIINNLFFSFNAIDDYAIENLNSLTRPFREIGLDQDPYKVDSFHKNRFSVYFYNTVRSYFKDEEDSSFEVFLNTIREYIQPPTFDEYGKKIDRFVNDQSDNYLFWNFVRKNIKDNSHLIGIVDRILEQLNNVELAKNNLKSAQVILENLAIVYESSEFIEINSTVSYLSGLLNYAKHFFDISNVTTDPESLKLMLFLAASIRDISDLESLCISDCLLARDPLVDPAYSKKTVLLKLKSLLEKNASGYNSLNKALTDLKNNDPWKNFMWLNPGFYSSLMRAEQLLSRFDSQTNNELLMNDDKSER